ncbi:MAG: hypothetical protein O9272_06565 [Brevundimonas sp.]|nr:hypothetical protein [Brevundimonas sp.]
MSEQFTRKFILKNFPVSFIEMDGKTVGLSQGEGMLKLASTYKAIRLGQDIKDPQTDESLGRLEAPIGTIKIVKVTEKMSIGILNGNFDATKFQPGIIELRDEIGLSAEAVPAAAPAGASPEPQQSTASGQGAKQSSPSSRPRRQKDDFDAPFSF